MKYTGIVQKGKGYGAKLGFPTANIPCESPIIPGVYAARVEVEGGMHDAAVYADTKHALIEAHLLDFAGDLYDKSITIELLKKMRDDKVFADENEARDYIAKDVETVKEYFRV